MAELPNPLGETGLRPLLPQPGLKPEEPKSDGGSTGSCHKSSVQPPTSQSTSVLGMASPNAFGSVRAISPTPLPPGPVNPSVARWCFRRIGWDSKSSPRFLTQIKRQEEASVKQQDSVHVLFCPLTGPRKILRPLPSCGVSLATSVGISDEPMSES